MITQTSPTQLESSLYDPNISQQSLRQTVISESKSNDLDHMYYVDLF